jgi:hypothetical protein
VSAPPQQQHHLSTGASTSTSTSTSSSSSTSTSASTGQYLHRHSLQVIHKAQAVEHMPAPALVDIPPAAHGRGSTAPPLFLP